MSDDTGKKLAEYIATGIVIGLAFLVGAIIVGAAWFVISLAFGL